MLKNGSHFSTEDVDFDVDLDSVDFTGYEGLLQHVWMNLIDNAVKFGPRGGLILTNNPIIAKRINSVKGPCP